MKTFHSLVGTQNKLLAQFCWCKWQNKVRHHAELQIFFQICFQESVQPQFRSVQGLTDMLNQGSHQFNATFIFPTYRLTSLRCKVWSKPRFHGSTTLSSHVCQSINPEAVMAVQFLNVYQE